MRREANPLSMPDRRLVRELWAEGRRIRREMDAIRVDAEERIGKLRAQARQLTKESLARKFECSLTQIHDIVGTR